MAEVGNLDAKLFTEPSLLFTYKVASTNSSVTIAKQGKAKSNSNAQQQ